MLVKMFDVLSKIDIPAKEWIVTNGRLNIYSLKFWGRLLKLTEVRLVRYGCLTFS
jgi:hypothetical protein